MNNISRRILLIFLLVAFVPVIRVLFDSGMSFDIGFTALILRGVLCSVGFVFLTFCYHFFIRNRSTLVGFDLLNFVIFSVVFFFIHTSYSLDNLEINTRLRQQIHTLDDGLISSIKNNNPNFMFDIFIDEAKGQGLENIAKLYKQLQNVIDDNPGVIEAEHLIISDEDSFVLQIPKGKDSFRVRLPRKSAQTYIIMRKFQNDINGFMMFNVYVKEGASWKLMNSHLGHQTVSNKTAYDWFKDADSYNKNEAYLMSFLSLGIASLLLKPAPFIEYTFSEQMQPFEEKLLGEIKKITWPFVIDGISSKPEVFTVKAQFLKGILYPRFSYVSKIPFKDTKALNKEGREIKEFLVSHFSGIDLDREHVLLLAHKELPLSPKKNYETYGIVIDLDDK